MRNLKIVDSTNLDDIVRNIPREGANFTNGTYAPPKDCILETTLTGFEFVNSQNNLPIVVAINSDASMRALGKTDFQSQRERADKIAAPLSEKFPNRQVIIIFYNEPTPTNLYQALNQRSLTKTLHKWGYGTDPKAPKIEGAEYFDKVYAFPLPNDTKSVCYYDTALPTEPQDVQVVDLRDEMKKAAAARATQQSHTSATANQITFMEDVKRFASDNKYSLFAAGATLAVAACVVVPRLISKSPGQN